jgi:sugar phosphate isomerase/epimerase
MNKQYDNGFGLLSRRQFIGSVAATGAILPLTGFSDLPTPTSATAQKPLICIFSKHLQWLSVPELANTVAELGFQGVDLSVRKGGHVEPSQAANELPKAVKLLKSAGLQVPMMVTDIVDADHPDTEILLKTAAQVGIGYYRMGYLKYDPKIGVAKNLDLYKKQIQKLAELNRKYNIHGAYQNHAGTNVGAAVWDLWELLRDADPKWMGCQYDIKHATAEGGMSWVNGLDVLKPHIRCMDIKDFIWAKKDGKWQNEVVPLGEGMVDYKTYLTLLKKHGISGPFSMHFEYPLGGADTGKKQLTISGSEVLSAMKRDLQTFRNLIKETSSAE